MRWKSDLKMCYSWKANITGGLTYHKFNMDVISDHFQAFEADHDPILGVVQIT